MKKPAGTDTPVCRDLARLAAACLQVPDFLVLADGPDGTPRWLDADFVPVARHWRATSCGEALLPEAVVLMSKIAVAMDTVVGSFLQLHVRAATTSRQTRRMAWEMKRQVIVGWLVQTGPRELNVAARTWQQRPRIPGQAADDRTLAWQAWELIHVVPELSTLRASLVCHMEDPRLPQHGLGEPFCGLHGAGP
jgi:hypothetical protein